MQKAKVPEFTIVIPAWNEEEAIGEAIAKVEAYFKGRHFELLIVDDGSSDKTALIVKGLMKKYSNLKLVQHAKNLGMGAAISTGFSRARGAVVINMDADLTHPLSKVDEMLRNIERGYDVVICSRYVSGGGMRGIPAWRQAITIVCNWIFRLIFWSGIRDMTSGFRAYRKEAAERISLKSRGFEAPLESSVKIIRMRLKFKEIPLVLGVRRRGSSKFNYKKAFKTYVPAVIKLFLYRWFGVEYGGVM
ncbi:MAG: glycosyltransferase [Candidatus Woesearchaeota archaeon]